MPEWREGWKEQASKGAKILCLSFFISRKRLVSRRTMSSSSSTTSYHTCFGRGVLREFLNVVLGQVMFGELGFGGFSSILFSSLFLIWKEDERCFVWVGLGYFGYGMAWVWGLTAELGVD